MLVVFCVRRAAKEPDNGSQSALNADDREDFEAWQSRLDEWGPDRNLVPSIASDVSVSVLQTIPFKPCHGSDVGSVRSQRSDNEPDSSASHRSGRAPSNATSPHSGSSSRPTSQSAADGATSQRSHSATAGHMIVRHALTKKNLAVHQAQLRKQDDHNISTERTPLL